jgi:hypothetical protein
MPISEKSILKEPAIARISGFRWNRKEELKIVFSYA